MNPPPDTLSAATPTDAAQRRADADRVVIVCIALSLAMVVLTAPHIVRHPATESHMVIRSVVDANAAPWWELTALHDIGPTLAHEIVSYRESMRAGDPARAGESAPAPSPVFGEPNDLMRVRGIGPKTLQRITDDLAFRGD